MENKEKENKADFIDSLLVIAKYKKTIIITTLIASLIAVAYSLLTPELWTSKVSILPSDDTSGGFSFDNSMFNFGASLLGVGGNQNSNQLIDVLASRTFTDKIITEFELIKYFKLKKDDELLNLHKARKIFHEKILAIKLDDETGLINIFVTTKDKYFSAEIANRFSALINEYNLEQKNTAGKLKKEFIQKRITEVEGVIDSLKTRLSEFGKVYKVISLEEQVAAVVNVYSELISKKLEADLEFEINKNIYGKNNPITQRIEINRSFINERLAELEGSKSDSLEYILNLSDIPNISMEYASIVMESEIQRKVYEFLLPQYEQAKIQELKDLPTIDIIDKAVPSGIRSEPKRARICIITFLLSLFISSFLSYSYDVMDTNGQNRKIKELMKSLLTNK